MKIQKIFYTPTFKKSWRDLPKDVQKKAIKREIIFREDCFQANLLTHKLTGKLRDYWSFSIDYHYRLVFRFLKENEALFVDIGTHEIYTLHTS